MGIIQIIILFIIFFLPGYLLLGKKFEDDEKFCFAFAFSTLMYAGLAVILHLFKIPIIWAIIGFPLSFITLFFRKPTFNISFKLLFIFGITLVIETILCNVSRFPTIGDSYWHFLAGKTFLTPNWTVLPFPDNYWQGLDKAFYIQYRPPLFNLILGFVFSIFGASFIIAKLVVVLFTTSILLPIYLIAKRLYGERCAIYSTILLITINSFSLSLTFEILVYPSATYFALCLFYLYLRREWNYIGLFGVVSYLTHPSSVIIILSVILFELMNSRKIIFETIKNRNIQINAQYFYPIFIFILIISPWLIRNYLIFGNPFYTSSRYAPIMRSWEDYLTLNPPTLKCYLEFILNPINFLNTKIGSIFLVFFPRPYSITFSTWDIQALWNLVELNKSLAGFLSYPLLAVVLYLLIKKPGNRISILFYLGLALTSILVGFRVTYIHSFLLPYCVLLGIFGIDMIKNRKIFIFLISVILIFQSIFTVYNRDKKKELSNQKLYSWIKNNIDKDEKIMNCDIHAIAYFSGRGGFFTPNEDINTILNCIKKWKVDYFIVGEVDLRLRDIDIKVVEKKYKLLKEIEGNRIYKTSAKLR